MLRLFFLRAGAFSETPPPQAFTNRAHAPLHRGRNVESPGEDPLLNGMYGTAYTQGLQQYTGTEKFVQAVVTLKHWLAYSIEGAQTQRGTGRHTIDVAVSAYDLAHTYMPPFEQTVRQGKALGIMCSYNAVNGLPTCGNPALNQTLRGDWGFDGPSCDLAWVVFDMPPKLECDIG